MTDPKVGDRVRIVIEGELIEVDEGGFVYTASNWRDYAELGKQGVVSIEVIPEPFVLPTKRYAQVLDSDGWLWTLGSERSFDWKNCNGKRLLDGELLKLPGLRVISEGVEE